MKRWITELLIVALATLSPALQAQGVEERGIVAAVSKLDHALDARDWKGVRGLLLDEITLDMPGREPVKMPAEDLIARWKNTLHAGKTSFHMRGSEVVTFDGADSAELRSKAQVRYEVIGIAGDDSYEVWANYVHELDRDDDVWRIRQIRYDPQLEHGNVAVYRHRLPKAPAKKKEAEPADESADTSPDASSETEADAPGDAAPADSGEPASEPDTTEADDAVTDDNDGKSNKDESS